MQLSGRKKEIFDILCSETRVSVGALARRLYVSEMTVRRDLAALEANGFITRYHGGAVARSEAPLPMSERIFLDEDEKRALALRAMEYLYDYASVFVDFSSTCQFILPHLKRFTGIRLFTNCVRTLSTAESLGVPCFLLGGEYYAPDMCLLGPAAERAADSINVDLAFFSAQGYTEDGRITDSLLPAVTVRERVMRHATRSVFLFERAKCGRQYLHTLPRVEQTELIIIS